MTYVKDNNKKIRDQKHSKQWNKNQTTCGTEILKELPYY